MFPKGCLAMRMRDTLGPVFDDTKFTNLFPSRGRPAVSPARLALVSVLQFTEGLTDRQAAHAVRSRLDWKYALGLELTDTGFDFSVLSEFRSRLVDGAAGRVILDAVLQAAGGAGLVKAGGRQRTDSTHVLAATRELNRLEFVVETLRAALNEIASVAGQWLASLAEPEWFDRYSTRPEDGRFPSRWAGRIEHGHQVISDGLMLLEAVGGPSAPAGLRQLPAVEFLRKVWVQQGEIHEGRPRWRDPQSIPPGRIRYCTPYDPEARTGAKRDRAWDGYKVHLSETCEPDAPHLITNVTTTPAAASDMEMTTAIHDELEERRLLPDEHLLDAGYVDAHHIAAARHDYGVEILGPVQTATGWQNKADEGFAVTDFVIDWDARTVTCPNGKTTAQWRQDRSQHGTPVIRSQFPAGTCSPCPERARCTRSTAKGRAITLRPRREHEALQQAKAQQETDVWKRQYQHRAGVEGTIAQAVHRFEARRSRYRGLAKTSLQHFFTAAAMNFARLDAWLTNTPLAPTRTSPFAALRPAG
ncbi:IS1182 family transposase [Streptomyces sp. NPDC048442]